MASISPVELYDYQKDAVEWCIAKEKECCILAFDMGMGKTIVTCEVINRNPVKTLVMVPASILEQWYCEMKRFTNLKIVKWHGISRKSTECMLKGADVIITTARVYSLEKEMAYFKGIERWVIDEAHRLRNQKGKIYKSLHEFGANVPNKMFLTGTPLCNSTQDIISLICLANIKSYSDEAYWNRMTPKDKLVNVKNLISNFMLRKTKAEVLSDVLPSKTVYEIKLTITGGDEASAYNSHTADEMALRRILRMRQSVNMLDAKNNGKKIGKINNIMGNIPGDDKVIIFSSLTTILTYVFNRLSIPDGCDRAKYINMYHGKQTLKERDSIIERFKKDDSCRVLLINIKSGGTGLNLVEANHVIIMDPYWNDSEQEQAINRIYRIGQKKDVFVYKLLIDNSIEKWMNLLQKSKLNTANYLIDNNEDLSLHEIMKQNMKMKSLFECIGGLCMEDFEKDDTKEKIGIFSDFKEAEEE